MLISFPHSATDPSCSPSRTHHSVHRHWIQSCKCRYDWLLLPLWSKWQWRQIILYSCKDINLTCCLCFHQQYNSQLLFYCLRLGSTLPVPVLWSNWANGCHSDVSCISVLLNLVVSTKSSKTTWYCNETRPVQSELLIIHFGEKWDKLPILPWHLMSTCLNHHFKAGLWSMPCVTANSSLCTEWDSLNSDNSHEVEPSFNLQQMCPSAVVF